MPAEGALTPKPFLPTFLDVDAYPAVARSCLVTVLHRERYRCLAPFRQAKAHRGYCCLVCVFTAV